MSVSNNNNSPLRTVLIIGASSAGAGLARELEKKLPLTHRIVLIDASSFAFWPIATLRAAVVPGWEKKVFEPLSQAFFSAKNPKTRHVMLPSTRVLELKKSSVIVDRENISAGFSTEIFFDTCVLAMGSTYRFPMRPSSTNQDEMVAALKQSQARIASASSILVVGGGATGVEYSGEIASHFPKAKTVTLVQSGPTLLASKYPPKLAKKLKAGLEQLGVRIVLNERVGQDLIEAGKGSFTTKSGETIRADLIIGAGGTTPNTRLVSHVDPSAVDQRGYITVDQFLQIKPTTGGDRHSPLKNGSYFAVGDCANNAGGPTAIKAGNDAKFAAANILASINGGKMRAVADPMIAFIVPIGASGGAALMPMVGVLGSWAASNIKGKSLLTPQFEQMYRQK